MKPTLKICYLFILFIVILFHSNANATSPPEVKISDQRFDIILEQLKHINNRIEQNHKSILREMDKRFEAVDKRFDAVDKRFDAVDKRFEAVDKRFDAVDKRFDAINIRIDDFKQEVNNRFADTNNFLMIIAGIFVTLVSITIGFALWDRLSMLSKARKDAEEIIKSYEKDKNSIAMNSYLSIQKVINVLKNYSEKHHEMRDLLAKAHLL